MEYAVALLLTIAIELPLVVAVCRRGGRRAIVPVVLAANLLTHPLAWYAVVELAWNWWAVEATVVTVETLVYVLVARLHPGRALAASLLANTVTAALGYFLA